MPSVTMFVMNDCDRDARVLKEARTLAEAGLDVRIIASLSQSTVPHEAREGFIIDRVVRHMPIRRLSRAVCRLLRALRESLRGGSRSSGSETSPESSIDPRTGAVGGTASRGKHTPRGEKRGAQPRGVFRRALRLLLPFYRPVRFLDYYAGAYRKAREAPTGVYHAHDLNTLPVAWWVRARFGGKLVYDSHEIYTETSNLRSLEKRAARSVERHLIGRADAVITISDSAAGELSQRYGIARPTVVKNCPRLQRSDACVPGFRNVLGLSENDRLALYQGGFSENRGLHNLVAAMDRLPSNHKLVMMGWGEVEQRIRAEAADLGLLDDRLFILPPVPQNDLVHWTATADVGVIPYRNTSLNNYLCLPNKLFEYMAAGLPVVASAFPELTNVIRACDIGMTFDPEDPDSIAEAMGAILGNDEVRLRLSRNALEAANTYSWENEEKRLLRVYSEVVS